MRLQAIVLLCTFWGCTRAAKHHDGGTDDDAVVHGFPELAICAAPEQCDTGLDCVASGPTSYCLQPCDTETPCHDGMRCDDDGYCLNAADYFQPCGRLDICADDALCDTASLTAPARCVPICAVGDLVGKS